MADSRSDLQPIGGRYKPGIRRRERLDSPGHLEAKAVCRVAPLSFDLLGTRSHSILRSKKRKDSGAPVDPAPTFTAECVSCISPLTISVFLTFQPQPSP